MPYPHSDFRDAPSPYASKPGEPPQLWPLDPKRYPLDMPDDHANDDDDLRPARGILFGLSLSLMLALGLVLGATGRSLVAWIVS